MPLNNPSSNTTVTDPSSSTSTRITGATSTTAAQIIPANTNRKGLTIYNPSAITVYIDSIASPTNSQHQFYLGENGFYEMPDNKIYTGAFYAIAASGTPTLEIREYT